MWAQRGEVGGTLCSLPLGAWQGPEERRTIGEDGPRPRPPAPLTPASLSLPASHGKGGPAARAAATARHARAECPALSVALDAHTPGLALKTRPRLRSTTRV